MMALKDHDSQPQPKCGESMRGEAAQMAKALERIGSPKIMTRGMREDR
jgi:hypothetical protein